MTSVVIGPVVANQVCFLFGRPGYEPGGFMQRLYAAISSADPQNLALLALGFPEQVAAMRMAMNTPGGLDMLQQIADGETVTAPAHMRLCRECMRFHNETWDHCLKCGPTVHPVDPDGVCIICEKLEATQ